MKKKILLLINCILLVACAAAFFYVSENGTKLLYPTKNEAALQRIPAECALTEENILTDFRFSQVSLVQDVEAGIFYLPLDPNTDEWEVGEFSSGQPGVEIVFLDEITATEKKDALRNGTKYEFYAVEGDRYRSYFLVFTGLPILSIEADATPDTEVFGGTIRFWEADNKQDWSYSNILEAHIRGNTSRIYPKKGYKLTLKKQDTIGNVVEDKRSLFGLREDDEFILNALYTDSSKIRDALCADIWSGLGAIVDSDPDMYLGTRMTYVEVFFNGEYRGLYGLMEPVDSKQLHLTKETDRSTVEYAYKASTPQTITTEEFRASETWTAEMAGYKLKGTYAQIGEESWNPLLEYLEWKNAEDSVFAEQAADMVSVDNMMRIWVYLQAVMGIDNRGKNMFYVAKYEDDAYRMYLAPWDMDLTLGDTLLEPTGEYPWDVGLNASIFRQRINFEPGDRMVTLDVAGARETVVKIWEEARKGVLSDAYLSEAVDRFCAQVVDTGAAGRDAERWPESMYGADYETVKTLIRYRMEVLDNYFYDNVAEYLMLDYS